MTGLTGDNKFSVTESQGHVAFKNQEIVDDVDNVVRNGPAEGKEPSARATSMVSRQATQPNRFLSAHAQAPNNGLSNGKFPSVHAANTVSSQAKKSKPKSSANPGGDKSRAVALKKQFPNANNIPKSVTKQEKKALVAQLTGNTNITNPVGPTNLTHQVPRNQVSAPQKSLFDKQLTNPGLNYDKAKKRAGVLKESYPKLAGLIPDAISSSARKTFIETHGKRGQKQQVIYELEPNPPREVRKTAENLGRQQEQYPGAQFTPLNPSRYPSSSSFQTVPQIDKRPARVSRYPIEPADKMAPLSDERRAEVARNLSGTSQDEPIEID